jgi:hypothetical protein
MKGKIAPRFVAAQTVIASKFESLRLPAPRQNLGLRRILLMCSIPKVLI